MKTISFIRDLFHQPFFVCLLAILTCLFFYLFKDRRIASKKSIRIIYIAIFAITFCIFTASAINRICHPQVWDFTCFYLFGKVATGGYNFYLPENFYHVLNSMHLPFSISDKLAADLVQVGFPYPPSTILYFAPLGFLSFKIALILWTVFNLLFAFGCIYLIYSIYFKSYKSNGILLVSILFFIFLPSLSTINTSQTNFIILFYLLLMKKYSDKKIAGVLLALAFFTKPYMLFFILFFILRKKWGAILYFAVSFILINGLTLVLFGKEVFISYLFDNPTQRIPAASFSEDINQSLNAVLIRHGLITVDHPEIYLYIILVVFLLSAILLLIYFKRNLYDFIWAILVLVSLIVYPGTLSHYGVLLLFIIFQFFNEKGQLGFNPYLSIAIIGIFYYLTTFSVFASMCFLLVIVVLKSFNFFQQKKLSPTKIQ